jgi:hypothetical protein
MKAIKTSYGARTFRCPLKVHGLTTEAFGQNNSTGSIIIMANPICEAIHDGRFADVSIHGRTGLKPATSSAPARASAQASSAGRPDILKHKMRPPNLASSVPREESPATRTPLQSPSRRERPPPSADRLHG